MRCVGVEIKFCLINRIIEDFVHVDILVLLAVIIRVLRKIAFLDFSIVPEQIAVVAIFILKVFSVLLLRHISGSTHQSMGERLELAFYVLFLLFKHSYTAINVELSDVDVMMLTFKCVQTVADRIVYPEYGVVSIYQLIRVDHLVLAHSEYLKMPLKEQIEYWEKELHC